MRIVTPIRPRSPLSLFALTKEGTTGRPPAGMSERLSRYALVARSASLTRDRIAVLLRETRVAGRGTPSPATFLPGSAQYVERDVTPTKQTVGEFLPGATTAYFASRMIQRDAQFGSRMFSRGSQCGARISIDRARSNRELRLLESGLTHRKQTVGSRSNRELSTVRN